MAHQTVLGHTMILRHAKDAVYQRNAKRQQVSRRAKMRCKLCRDEVNEDFFFQPNYYEECG